MINYLEFQNIINELYELWDKLLEHDFFLVRDIQIDNVLNNIYERNPVKLRENTPEVLVNLGIKNLPMYENPAHIRKNILSEEEARIKNIKIYENHHYHGLGKNLYLKVVDNLDKPSIVYNSLKNKSDYIIITEVKNEKGNKVIVPIDINSVSTAHYMDINNNRIKSIYPKSSIYKYLYNELKKDNICLIYKKKATGTGKIPAAVLPSSDNSITRSETYVNKRIKKNNQIQQKNQDGVPKGILPKEPDLTSDSIVAKSEKAVNNLESKKKATGTGPIPAAVLLSSDNNIPNSKTNVKEYPTDEVITFTVEEECLIYG